MGSGRASRSREKSRDNVTSASYMAKTLRTSKLALAAETVIADYRLAYSSRLGSILGRAEGLRGDASFGLFGDGEDGAQLTMAKTFRPGGSRPRSLPAHTFMFTPAISTCAAT